MDESTSNRVIRFFFFPAITGAGLFHKNIRVPPLSTLRALDIYEESLAPSPVYITAYDNSIRPARGRLIADVQIGLKNAKPFGPPSMS